MTRQGRSFGLLLGRQSTFPEEFQHASKTPLFNRTDFSSTFSLVILPAAAASPGKMSGAALRSRSGMRALGAMRGAWASLNSMASLSLQGGSGSGLAVGSMQASLSGLSSVGSFSGRFYSSALSRSGVSSVSGSGIPFPFRGSGARAAPFMNSRVMMSTFATEYDAHVRLVLC